MGTISASKSITIKGVGTFTLKAEFSSNQDNNNVALNTSPVTAKATLTKGTGSFSYSTRQGTLYILWHDNKNNTDTLWDSMDVKKLMEGSVSISATKNVAHNDDGSLSGYAIAKWTKASGGSQYAPASGTVATDTKKFDTIARASVPTLSVSQATLGSTKVVINTNKKADFFNHKLSYSVNGSAEIEIATNVVDSFEWIPVLSIANNFTNAIDGEIVIKCKTFNGTTQIGETKEVKLKVLIPDSVKPSISKVALEELSDVMKAKNWGVYVQNHSKIKGKVTAVGSYGSVINSYTIKINNELFVESEFETSIITIVNPTIDVTVVDSRGRKATYQASVPVLAYEFPSITEFVVNRNITTNTKMDVSFKCKHYKVNGKNTKKFVLFYKKTKDTNYTSLTITNVSAESTTNDYIIYKGSTQLTITTGDSYQAYLVVTDAFKDVSSTVKDVNTVFKLFNITADKKYFAVGKLHEEVGYNEFAVPQLHLANIYRKDGNYQGAFLSCPNINSGKMTYNSGNKTLEYQNGSSNHKIPVITGDMMPYYAVKSGSLVQLKNASGGNLFPVVETDYVVVGTFTE